MSDTDPSGQVPVPAPAEDAEALAPPESLAQLQEKLGFHETAEMQDLRAPLIEAMARPDPVLIRELLGRYQQLGEELIDHSAPSPDLDSLIKQNIKNAAIKLP